MKLIIDCFKLVKGSGKSIGIYNLAQNLVRELAKNKGDDGNEIVVGVEDKGEFNLAVVLEDLNEKPVKFSFSYDEDYEEPEIKADPETGEVI